MDIEFQFGKSVFSLLSKQRVEGGDGCTPM
jgi:hypothetical protein